MKPWTFLKSIFRKRAKAADVDDSLLAPYRRKPLALAVRIALYATLGAVFIGYGLIYGLTAPFQIVPLAVPIVLTAFLIVWALPPGERTPWRAIEPLFLGFFAALMMWPDYLAVALPYLPWITLKRMFATPMAFTFLICLSMSRDFRGNMGRILNSDPWIWRLMLLFIFIQTSTIIFSFDPGKSINKWVVYQLNWSLIFFASCFLFALKGFPERWVKMLLVSGFAVCFFGLWEQKNDLLPWAGHIPAFLKIEDDSVIRMLAGTVRSQKGIHRVQSISTTPLGMAELLALIAPFALHVALTSKQVVWRVAAALYLPLALQLVLFADSRLGMIALMGAVLFYVLIWGALKWRRERHDMFAPALVLSYPLLFSMVLTSTFVVGRIHARVWGDGSQGASDDSRGTQWAMGLPKIEAHPFGHGIGGAAVNLGYIQEGGILTIDSYFLTLLMDVGFLGFAVYFAMFLRGIWSSAKTAVTYTVEGELGVMVPMAVALTNFVIVKAVFSQDANHPLVFMMLGGMVALVYRAKLGVALPVTTAGKATRRRGSSVVLPARG